jgi:hypothetical protein
MFARAYFPGRTGQLLIAPREGSFITRPDPDVAYMRGSPFRGVHKRRRAARRRRGEARYAAAREIKRVLTPRQSQVGFLFRHSAYGGRKLLAYSEIRELHF